MDAAIIDGRDLCADAVAINSDLLDIILYCDFTTNDEKKFKIRNLAKVAVNYYNPLPQVTRSDCGKVYSMRKLE